MRGASNLVRKIVMEPKRNQVEARRVVKVAYPYPGCCLAEEAAMLIFLNDSEKILD
jgi:hypothetical protein